jgi:hypothetical protein
MAVITYSRKKDGEKQLSTNFKVKDFACKCKENCDVIKIDTALVERLEKIRDKYGVDVKIVSGFRCEKHNKEVGGSSGSQHKEGKAADIAVGNYLHKEGPVTYLDIRKYALTIGLSYENKVCHLHLDTRNINKPTVVNAPSGTKIDCALNRGAGCCKYNPINPDQPPVSNPPIPTGTLRNGTKNDQVKWLQTALNKVMNAGLAIDGSYGPLTETAVKNFQKKYTLAVDGIFGPKSLEKMLTLYKG